MYRFGCQWFDTRRYDTDIPFVLVDVVSDIDEECDHNGAIWRRKDVYAQVKKVLQGMANDPSRSDDTGFRAGRSRIRSIQVAMAARAGEFAEARQLLDELGDHLDRPAFDRWCNNPECELARIHALSGKGAPDLQKAWKTLAEAPRPFTDQSLKAVSKLYQKALAADDDERTQAFCRCWINELDGRMAFGAGKWFEKKFDKGLLCWTMVNGAWSMENESDCDRSFPPGTLPRLPTAQFFSVVSAGNRVRHRTARPARVSCRPRIVHSSTGSR